MSENDRIVALEREIHLLRLEVNRLRASNRNIWEMARSFAKAAKRVRRR